MAVASTSLAGLPTRECLRTSPTNLTVNEMEVDIREELLPRYSLKSSMILFTGSGLDASLS